MYQCRCSLCSKLAQPTLDSDQCFYPGPTKEKLRWDLLPWKPLESVVRVMMAGAGKHAPDDWKKVSVDDHKRALLRHVLSYITGDKVDAESGQSHLAHAVCRCLFIISLESGK